MKELREILDAFDLLEQDGESAVLATVVGVRGSTYRSVGARVLMHADEMMIGLIGGGCLEADLLERSQRVRSSGVSELVQYDSTSEQDRVWGLGIGCAGVVDVLVERVSAATPGPLVWLRRWLRGRRVAAMATCLTPQLGKRYALDPLGKPSPVEIDHAAIAVALKTSLVSGRGREVRSKHETWIIELFRPPRRLVVFGAGPDAVPLYRLAIELGWEVEILDHRAALAVPERFPKAQVRCGSVDCLASLAEIDADTYCAVMTHNYSNDQAITRNLLETESPYVAVLGSRERTRMFLSELYEDNPSALSENRGRIFAPAGLDLGAEAPEQIALAIIAEIQAVGAGRTGGSLRDCRVQSRGQPVH